MDGDGCSQGKVDEGYECEGSVSVCMYVCGDLRVRGPQECV